MRIKHIDPDMDAALTDLKAAIDNEVWREWCDAVMACQADRSLTSILTPIVSKLSDMRVVNAELENLVFGPRKEFIACKIEERSRPMEGKKNLCAMIPAELHARIMAEKEEMKLGTLAEYVERIFAEHFKGGNDMQTERTLAVKISAGLFDRLKEYLEKNHLKQKEFITQLLQQALDNAEE